MVPAELHRSLSPQPMDNQNLYDEREILYQLAEGSESAFIQIFDEYSPKVYRAALKFLDSKESAEEVVQDIFMDIWLRREKLTKILNFGAYLHGMVRNQVYDAYRQKYALSEAIKELGYNKQSDNPTERLILEGEYEKLLHEAVGKLPKIQQEIYRLAREECLSHEEIALRLNLSRLAVKSHMKRSLRILRIWLEPFLKTEIYFLLLLFL